uniref:Conserved oligomeric Golgi complex subunit 6 n=1 Tax=Amazona collaria TaxID=241587 RepID=A0A8B9G5H5_9PSIT
RPIRFPLSLLQSKRPQSPQPFLIRLVLQPFHHLHCPSQDSLQQLIISLVLRGLELNTNHSYPTSGSEPSFLPRSQNDLFIPPSASCIRDPTSSQSTVVGRRPRLGRNQSLRSAFPPEPVHLRGAGVAMADTAASQLLAVPSPGLPAAPGSNPLSRKLNKILETRLDNDKEMLEALKALSTFFVENSLRTRRNLRGDIERRSLAINEEFVHIFKQVKEELESINEDVQAMSSCCEDMSSRLKVIYK